MQKITITYQAEVMDAREAAVGEQQLEAEASKVEALLYGVESKARVWVEEPRQEEVVADESWSLSEGQVAASLQ